jgi:hypothetical protein
MKPGLLFPRFYTTEPVNAERVDDQVRGLTEQINGGLDASSLAPNAQLATSLFSENRSLYMLSGYASNNTSAGASLGVLNVASEVVGVGWSIVVASAITYRTLNLYFNRLVYLQLEISNPAIGRQFKYGPYVMLTGTYWLDGGNTLAAGSTASFTVGVVGSEVRAAHVNVALMATHVT